MAQKKQATYYLVNSGDAKSFQLCIARIVEKAYLANFSSFIFFDSLEKAQALDDQLWTFRDISFIPHEIYHSELQEFPPVLLSRENPPAKYREVLVNLTETLPSFWQDFERIIEVINVNDEKAKVLARKRYKVYENAGYQMVSHQV
jgi:DNA polymerase III subunit chi